MADDFEIIGKIVVDESGAVSIQGLNDKLDETATRTSALGNISDFVWGGIILKGIEAVTSAIGDAIGSIGEFFSSSIDSAMESQDVMARVQAVVTSTGGAAGYTAAQLGDMANGLQQVTTFSDETILRGQSMLLTFTNIGRDVFPMATDAMLDIAQMMGSDVQGAAIQLGKALNDPINGITALSRVGVKFTDDMKEQIKTMVESGDIMGAQKIILGELQTEFGLAAEAAGTTFSGQMKIAANEIDNFKELVGGPLLAAMSEFRMSIINTVMASQGFVDLQAFLQRVNDLMQGGMPLWSSLALALTEIGNGNTFITSLADALERMQTAIQDGATPWQALLNVLLNLAEGSPIGKGIADMQAAFQQIATDIAPTMNEVFAAIKDAMGELAQFLVPFLADEFNKIGAFFKENGPAIAASIKEWGGFIKDYVIPAVVFLVEVFFEVIGVIGDIIMWLEKMNIQFTALDLTGMAKKLGTDFVDWVSSAWNNLVLKAAEVAGAIQEWWQNVVNYFAAIPSAIQSAIGAAIQAVKDVIAGWISGIFDSLGIDQAKFIQQWQSIFDDIVLIVDTVKQRITQLIANIVGSIIGGFVDAGSQVNSIVSPIYDRVVTIFGAIKDYIANVMAAIGTYFASGWQALVGMVNTYVMPVVNAIVNVFNAAKTYISSAISAAISLALGSISVAWSELYGIGSDIVEGIIQGIQSYVGNLLQAATDMVQQFLQKVKEFLGIASPSSVFAEIGGNIVQGIINGIDSGWDTFATWFKGLWTNLLENLTWENILAIVRGNMSLADLFGGGSSAPAPVVPTTPGGTGGTSPLGGGGLGQTVNNYFYGPVYIGTQDDLNNANYNCPSPNPIVAATMGNITPP